VKATTAHDCGGADINHQHHHHHHHHDNNNNNKITVFGADDIPGGVHCTEYSYLVVVVQGQNASVQVTLSSRPAVTKRACLPVGERQVTDLVHSSGKWPAGAGPSDCWNKELILLSKPLGHSVFVFVFFFFLFFFFSIDLRSGLNHRLVITAYVTGWWE